MRERRPGPFLAGCAIGAAARYSVIVCAVRTIASVLGVAALFVAGWALAIWAAGDRFFEVNGIVVDCVSGEVVPGVMVRADLIRGFGEEPHTVETDEDGRFELLLNEPPHSAAQLTLTHPGYQPLTKVLDPAPPHDESIRWCLETNRGAGD